MFLALCVFWVSVDFVAGSLAHCLVVSGFGLTDYVSKAEDRNTNDGWALLECLQPFLFTLIYCTFLLYSLSLSPPPHLLLWEFRLVFWTKSNQLGLWRRKASSLEISSAYKSMGLSTHMSHLHTLPQFHWASLMKAACVCVSVYLCASIGVLLLLKEMEKYIRLKCWYDDVIMLVMNEGDLWLKQLEPPLQLSQNFLSVKPDPLSQETVWMSYAGKEGRWRMFIESI